MRSLGLGGLFLSIPHWINIECLPCATRQCTMILEAERWDQNRHRSSLSRNTETRLTIKNRKMLWEQTETFTSPGNWVRCHRLFIVITKFRCTCWKGIYQGKREGKFQAGKTVSWKVLWKGKPGTFKKWKMSYMGCKHKRTKGIEVKIN